MQNKEQRQTFNTDLYFWIMSHVNVSLIHNINFKTILNSFKGQFLYKEGVIMSKNKIIPQVNFPGGPLVKNPPGSVGDIGLIPDLGRSHMPQSK